MSYNHYVNERNLALNGDCYLFHYCCEEDTRCKDCRCVPKDSKENKVQWAPKRFKCECFHHLIENCECQSH